jgi:hypothetical protein
MKFEPISYSWVALHPEPKGVIQFIGGAFFGTFWPMLFYRNLLQRLFDEKYTIIILPFNFTFDHYTEAGFLIREQYEIMPELVRRSILRNYNYQNNLKDKNFSWLGHSIGCKYISLLEAFGALPICDDPEIQKRELTKFISQVIRDAHTSYPPAKIEAIVQRVVTDLLILINELKKKRIEALKLIDYYVGQDTKIKNFDLNIEIASIFIKGQDSVLLAPDNSGTSAAIKPKVLADFIDALGLGVKPSPNETYALIKDSNLFNLLGLVKFEKDTIAKDTVNWFINILQKPPQDQNLIADLKGGHLRPLGVQIGNSVINFPDTLTVPFIESPESKYKSFDSYVIELLKKLTIKSKSN